VLRRFAEVSCRSFGLVQETPFVKIIEQILYVADVKDPLTWVFRRDSFDDLAVVERAGWAPVKLIFECVGQSLSINHCGEQTNTHDSVMAE